METIDTLFDHVRMARAYLSEGRFDEAERLYLLALSVSEEFYGPTSAEVLTHLENLADFYLARAKHVEALPLLERLYGMYMGLRQEATLSQHASRLLETIEKLSTVQEKLGQGDQVEKLYLSALRAAEKDFGADDETTLEVLAKLGDFYMRTGVYVAARAVFEELLEVKFSKHGADCAALSTVLSALAEVYGKLHLYYDRIAVLERQVAITEALHAGAGVALASQLTRLGEALSVASRQYQCKEFAERAELTFCRALSIYERFNGANTPTVQALRTRINTLAAK